MLHLSVLISPGQGTERKSCTNFIGKDLVQIMSNPFPVISFCQKQSVEYTFGVKNKNNLNFYFISPELFCKKYFHI